MEPLTTESFNHQYDDVFPRLKTLFSLQKLDNQLKLETDKVKSLDLALSNCKEELKLILEQAQKTQEKYSHKLKEKDSEVTQIFLITVSRC